MEAYRSLSAEEVRQIAGGYYADRARKTVALDQPSFVYVGAQPGAGKTTAGKMVRAELRERGGFIHIDADRMRESIPVHGSRPTSEQTQQDAGRLVGELRSRALDGRRNALEEGTFRDTDAALASIQARKADGYRVELIAVATPREESLLGIYQRYEAQYAAGALNPRFVPQAYHDTAMKGFDKTFQSVENVVDRVRVVTREGELLHDSARQKNPYPSAYAALRAGQELTPERREQVQNGWAIVGELARSRGADPVYMSAVRDNAAEVARLPSPASAVALKLAKDAGLSGERLDAARKQIEALGARTGSQNLRVVDTAYRPPSPAPTVPTPSRGKDAPER